MALGRTSRWKVCALAAALVLGGCVESVFREDADRQVYRIERQRQRETLGTVSDTAIAPGQDNIRLTGEDYEKAPRTDNNIGAATQAVGTSQATPAPASVPMTQPAGLPTTIPAGSALEQLLSGEAELKAEIPPLPEFPRQPPAGKTRRIFALDDCFHYGLAHAREYVARKEDLYLATLAVTLERHAFEPRFFAQSSVGVSGAGEYSDYASALNAAQTFGVRQKLPYGGEVVATALASTVSKLRQGVTESQSAAAVLEANIPLLRGAGMVAQENLIQAERELVYEVREFERYRRAFLVSVASQYFSLVNQRAQILNRFRNVESYTFIRKRTQALFEAGRPRVGLLDVQRAKQAELQARSDLVAVIDQYELSVDNFKLLLGMSTSEPLDIRPQYLSVSPPETDETAAMRVAEVLRLDLQTVRDRVEDARRKVKLAGNNLLPDLNLSGKASLGTDPTRKTFAVQGERLDYSAGLTLDWPLDRVAERNAYRISQINLQRAQRSVEQAQDQVTIDVRAAVRLVRQQNYQVLLQRNNIALATRRKAFADIQFRDGKIDNRDYLDAETALLDAQNRLAQAISSQQIATLAYLRDTDQLRVDAQGKLIAPTDALGFSKPPATRPRP